MVGEQMTSPWKCHVAVGMDAGMLSGGPVMGFQGEEPNHGLLCSACTPHRMECNLGILCGPYQL